MKVKTSGAKIKLQKQNSFQGKRALIVIDVQKVYTDPDSELFCSDSKNTVKRINKLIKYFSEQGAPVIYVRHEHKTDGSDSGHLFDFNGEQEEIGFLKGTPEVDYDERLIIPEKPVEIVKTRYSCFPGTKLDRILRERGVESIAICGFMTNFCCESTARDALDRDYYIDFIVDATGTPGTEEFDESKVRKVVAELLSAGFARVINTKNYLKLR